MDAVNELNIQCISDVMPLFHHNNLAESGIK